MMDFSGGAGAGSPMDLIPNGQMAFAIISYRGLKASKTPNEKTGQYGQYLDLELVIDAGQPFERRKVWTRIMDPMHAGNSDDAKQMGMAAISRILEAGRGASQQNPAGYQIANYEQLDGLRCAIKIKVAKGSEGYADKNEVADFLSPNPVSASFKSWQKLVAGVFNVNGGGAAAPQGSFGFAATAPAPAQGGFGFQQPPQQVQQPAQTGFGQPAQQVHAAPMQQGAQPVGAAPFGMPGAAAGAAAPSTVATPMGNASTAPSPSNPPNPNAPAPWLQQAQGAPAA